MLVDKTYPCKHCSRECTSQAQHRGHQGKCKLNPDRKVPGRPKGAKDKQKRRPRSDKGKPGPVKSETHCQALSEARKLKWQDPEYRLKMDAGKTESNRKQSITKRAKFLSGELSPNHTRRVHYNGRTYRSSWEYIFAAYCDLAGIEFEYEKIRVQTHKVWISDFLVGKILYEVGWHDHTESVAAFAVEGWTTYIIGKDEIEIMSSYLNG